MKKSYNLLTEQDKQNIIDTYYNKTDMNFNEISNLLQVSERSFARVLKENNINTSLKNRYTLNENYFDTINSEHKSYFLGFLFADGFVGDDKFNNIVLSVHEKDRTILDIFKKELNFTGNIRTNKNKIGYKKTGIQYVINFSSKHMAETLRTYGLVKNRKSIIKNIPSCIPNNLINHFIRGYFDGDGSVCAYNKKNNVKLKDGSIKTYHYKKVKIDLICNKDFGETIMKYIGINSCHFSKSKCNDLYYLSIQAKNDLCIYKSYIYNNATIYLNRKYNKF